MRVYLDYNATTPVDSAVLEAMLPYLRDNFGNAGSVHTPGQRARGGVDAARESVAALIGAKPSEIVFTSGGTEADNLALFGVVADSPGARKHVITTSIEHHAVLHSCEEIVRRGSRLRSSLFRRSADLKAWLMLRIFGGPASRDGADQRDAREQRTRHYPTD